MYIKNGNGSTISLLPFLFHNTAKLPFSPLKPPPLPPAPDGMGGGKSSVNDLLIILGTEQIGHKLIRKRFKKLQLDNIC